MNKLRVTSLFSGIGAFEKALLNLKVDFEIVNYCEIDKYASHAYSVLYDVPESLNLGDVSKVKTETLKDFDLLTYGFPCQDISLAGKCRGIKKGETRSGLLYEALRILEYKKPKFAIAENVKNLISNMFIEDFNLMLNELDRLGYNSYWKVINAKDYGSVQSRERVFVVSIRKDIDTGFKFPNEIKSNIKFKDIKESTIEEKYYCNNESIQDYIQRLDRKLIAKNNPKSGLVRLPDIKNTHALDMNNRVFSESGLIPTVLTSGNSAPKVIEYRVRRLTALEAWRATGFTDRDYFKVKNALIEKFKIKGECQLYKMAGNSIVVQVPENLFKSLLEVE